MKSTLRAAIPAYAVPVLVFVILISLTTLVWREQAENQRSQLRAHTVDVTMQAARRLEIHVQSRLTIASIFSEHWETHKGETFSQKAFQEFATVLKRAVPGYHVIRFVPAQGGAGWTVPATASSAFSPGDPSHAAILRHAHRINRMELSPPLRLKGYDRAFFAALPIRRGSIFLGWIIVEFRIQSLVDSCFLHRIRSEFRFQISDDAEVLYRHPSKSSGFRRAGAPVASRTFRLENRQWRLSMTPRSESGRASVWFVKLWVFGFGLLLSLGISLSIAALAHRMRMYRRAHARALRELEERQRAEARLRASETRYRNVFDSATDGILVFAQDGVIIEANAAACAMHGYEDGALVGMEVPSLLSPTSRERYDDFMVEIESGEPMQIESTHLRKDGSPLEVEVRGVQFAYGGHERVLAILSDVTLHRQAQARQAQLARQALMAQEEERARVSRDLHDELGQILTAMRLELDLSRKRAGATSGELDYATELLEKATEELRRICRGLRPPLLDDLGAVPAVRLLVQEFEQHAGIDVTLETDVSDEEREMSPEVALCVYRILQEALTNVRRHAEAHRVTISLLLEPNALVLTVTDDGYGFEPSQIGQQGSGLAGMQERAGLVGGTLEVSSVVGKGTRVEARMPRPEARKEKRK